MSQWWEWIYAAYAYHAGDESPKENLRIQLILKPWPCNNVLEKSPEKAFSTECRVPVVWSIEYADQMRYHVIPIHVYGLGFHETTSPFTTTGWAAGTDAYIRIVSRTTQADHLGADISSNQMSRRVFWPFHNEAANNHHDSYLQPDSFADEAAEWSFIGLQNSQPGLGSPGTKRRLEESGPSRIELWATQDTVLTSACDDNTKPRINAHSDNQVIARAYMSPIPLWLYPEWIVRNVDGQGRSVKLAMNIILSSILPTIAC
ncbi:hypothetical protein WOLCODRAFT_20903 [Wolfiporia cocos MD-104 SS10]|uniref:Uncharacterized protein n=1 Tax=Wolfiporia cocos (strain MD-104) TaxID=742152 RepID=A0A2H3J555_WOLCO|nr:hypothetical protein WOLCODRAFT_20903 [Wolfiporia cocos MD-104 SS10]